MPELNHLQMQVNTILIFHNSGLNAKCFRVKLKLLANRFLHLQFYILHHLKEEGSGANNMDAKTNTIFGTGGGDPLDFRGLQKSPKKLQILFFNKKLEDFENHQISCLIGLCNEFNLNPWNFLLKNNWCQFWTFCNPLVLRDPLAPKIILLCATMFWPQIPSPLSDAMYNVGGVEICPPTTWALQKNKVLNSTI